MTDTPAKPVLLTGAAGGLGRQLAPALAARGWKLVLTDLVPFPDALPEGARFVRADLADGPAILRLAEGCGTVLHFGGVSTEHPFEQVVDANIRGLYHIYEAARRERARVVFASSNHAVGFHERAEPLDDDCQLLPDSYYGLSKVYGEMMGRMYWFKHGVETVAVRIGSSFPRPVDARMLSTWLSYADLIRLMERATLSPATGCCVIWGASANARSFWRQDARGSLGGAPQDSADPFTAELADKRTQAVFTERYQGGGYTDIDRTRPTPVQGRLFE